jgi:hypothetical protein
MAKARFGFVSNSSSSSFLVAIKTSEPITKASLLSLLGIPEDSQGAKFFDEVISEIANGAVWEQREEDKDDTTPKYKAQKKELQRQLAEVQTSLQVEEDKTSKYAQSLIAIMFRLHAEIKSVQETLDFYGDAPTGPFAEEREEGGWQILKVVTDEREGIDSLQCDVIKVDSEENY